MQKNRRFALDDRELIHTQLQSGLKPVAIATVCGVPELASRANVHAMADWRCLSFNPLSGRQVAFFPAEPTCVRDRYPSRRALWVS
jgi:hypothetical protein